MLIDLNFIKTTLNGIRSMEARLLGRISEVDGKIHTPDLAAKEGQDGYIRNKSTLIGRAGTGDGAELFNGALVASGSYAHAEGEGTVASGDSAHAEGYGTTASGRFAHAEGYRCDASGDSAHAEGSMTTANGVSAHAEGKLTSANGDAQHVQGRYNIIDDANKYAHIVGNGEAGDRRSNAHTLDWNGNAWFAGTIEGTALILRSSSQGSTKRFQITVDDSGTITATEVTA